MTNQQREMIEYTTQELVQYLMEDEHITLDAAMQRIYCSDTFKHLQNIHTGLYLEGSAYVYELWKREKSTISA